MYKSNLPKDLPLLPGNQYADPTVTRYHKMQLLGVKDGAITGTSSSLTAQSKRERSRSKSTASC